MWRDRRRTRERAGREKKAARAVSRVDAHLRLVPKLALPAQVHLKQPEVGGVRELVQDLVKLVLVRGLHLFDVTLRVSNLPRHRERRPLRQNSSDRDDTQAQQSKNHPEVWR